MCAVFLASSNNGNSTEFESYPAVYLEKLADTSSEVLKAESGEGLRTALESHPADGFGPWTARTWYKAGVHPYLSNVLPCVNFYLVADLGQHTRNSGEWLVAVNDSDCYLLPQELNQLLYDAGMDFGNSDISTWIRVGTLVWTAVPREGIHAQLQALVQLQSGRNGWDDPLFPALAIEHVGMDTASVGVEATGSVVINLQGQRRELRVTAGRTWLHGADKGGTWLVPRRFQAVTEDGWGEYIQLDPIETGKLD
jgi:hypothetical protein